LNSTFASEEDKTTYNYKLGPSSSAEEEKKYKTLSKNQKKHKKNDKKATPTPG